ncbi:MAG: PAS domain S-box protein, partial [Chlorobiales bacterium]|nr:PAS domain S-box protein [Chlorobiales bacterium]
MLSPKELSSELFSVSLLIQQSKDFHQKLGHLCDALVNFCGFSFASVILLSDSKSSLRVRLGHIKALSNTAGLKARDFFESVARPGTELIREYYDSIFQDEYEVINTYCVPPDITYPILQASGISDLKVASNLIRFCVVPQVIDDSLHRKIIPPLQKNGSQKTKSFLAENEPLQMFNAIYNGTLPADNEDIYGVYIPIRDSSRKILGILSLGPRITQATVSQEDSLAYHCAFEPLISHLALELENEELKRQTSGGQEKAELFKPSDFIAFLSGLDQQETPQDKFDFICKQVQKHSKAEIVFGVLFNGNLLIEKTSLATHVPQLESEISNFYNSNFSVGNHIHAEFLGALFLPEYQTSNSYLVTDEQLSAIELYSHAIFGFRKGLSREKLTGEGTIFTPISNKSGLITGYVAAVFDPRPLDPVPIAEIVEFYTQFISNEPFASPNKTAVTEVGHRTQFASVFDLADSLHFHSTLEEKAQAIARGVLRIGGLSSATIVLYNEQDHIAHQQTYPAEESEPAPPARPVALCKSGGIEKFASDAIFMTPGFKFNNCFCFNADQVPQILSALESGNEPPIEFSSPFIGEENFASFLGDPNIGIFIPMKSGRYTFGYVGIGDPLPDTTSETFKDRLSLLTIFINKAATHLWQLQLEEQTAKQSRGKASLKELLSSLLATNEQIQSRAPIEEKVEKVINAVVELFGLTYAALAMYDKSYRITYSSYKFHPQSVHAGNQQNFANRFKPGRHASEHILKTIFSEPFSAGPCAIFKVPQLRDAIRQKPLSYSQRSLTILNDEPVNVTSLSLNNISDYLSGDQKVGLMLPLYGEHGRLVGTVSLGGTLFAGDIADTTEFIERIKIIAHFTAQVFRDFQLSQAEAQREEESRKLRKKNIFIQTLLELNVTLAQPISKHEKFVAICERSVANSDFCFVSALLLNGDDLLITDYYQAINTRQEQCTEKPSEQKLIGNQHLNKDFLTHALSEENRVSNSYCFDFRQVVKQIGSTENLVIQGKELKTITEPISTEGALPHKDAFEVFYNARKDDSTPVTFLTPIYTSGGDLLGLIVIGKVLPGIKKSSVEAVGDIMLMELVAKSLARNLENTLLTERLSRWDAKFRNVVENVQHGFILFDSTGKIEFVNGFIRQILGYQSKQMLGKSLADFVPPDCIEKAARHQKLVQKELREA